MTEIVAGEYITNESSKNAMGGTELMAHRMIKYLDPELLKDFQIIHSRVRELRPDLKKILVCHDLHNDPEVGKLAEPEYRKNFDKIVFVSNWQAQMYNASLGIPYDEFVVIPNAIEPFEDVEKDFSGTIKLIYHTTPHRGLELLVPAFKELSKNFDIHLDVFSSFKMYGWEQRDQPYEKLFDTIRSLPNATYHGYQPNDVIREKLKETHIFAYPCIWPETSCLAAIEALCAGNLMVHPNLAALPETCEHGTMMYQFNEDPNKHIRQFFVSLHGTLEAIKNQPDIAKTVALNGKRHYNNVYKWDNIASRWNALLRSFL